ncbi:MAG: class I SAM-dependent methyltransferase [Gammaproteobacteria bacterium]|nr:class I SAM-dependent methyltransferase [Gammaproteobacteria bacterium]
MLNNLERVGQLVRANLECADGDATRLLHGRGRTVPGWEQVAIDYFHPLVLVTLFAAQQAGWLNRLIAALWDWAAASGVECIAVQSRFASDTPLQVLRGELPRKPLAVEAGLQYGLQLGGRRNIGFFLDMAQARRWLAGVAAGKRVLNLFAYTCAFSVVARAAGAVQVVNLDMSSAALRMGQQNHQRNGINSGVSYLSHKLFRSWSKLRRAGPFDIVIVDPPSRQPGSFVAATDYRRVVAKLPELCAPDAEILLCLNSPHLETAFLRELAADNAPQLQFVERLPNPPQFADTHPERSLKVFRFRYCDSR